MKFIIAIVLAITITMVAAYPEPSYGGHKDHAVQPGPAKEYTFPVKGPVVKCSHNLLINCNPHQGVVPCKPDHKPAKAY